LALLLVLSLCSVAFSFTPTFLECGSEADLYEASFPFEIRIPMDEYTVYVTSLAKKGPSVKTSVEVNSIEEAFRVIEYYRFLDINRTSTSIDGVFQTFDIENATYEATAVKTDECEGIYLKTVLSTGTNIEFSWIIYKEPHVYDYGQQTIPTTRAAQKSRYYVTNHTYSFPEWSNPSFERFTLMHTPLPSNTNWDKILSEANITPDPAFPNMTYYPSTLKSISELNNVTREYTIEEFISTAYMLNYGVNQDGMTLVQQRAIVHELSGLDPVSFTTFEALIANYSGPTDYAYWDSVFTMTAKVTMPESSGAQGLSILNLWALLFGIVSMLF
jgi:hypothetical protein